MHFKQDNDRLTDTLFGALGSQSVLSALKLGIFPLLARGEATPREVAAGIGADTRATKMLLDAMAGLGRLERDGDCYRLSGRLRRLLEVPGVEAETYFADEQEHVRRLFEGWSQIEEVIISGRPISSVNGSDSDEEFFPHLARHLFPGNYLLSRELLESLPDRFRSRPLCLLDVGAGSAAWSIPFAEADKDTSVVAVDFKPVLDVTKHFTTACGVGNQYELRAGDLRDIRFETESYEIAFLGHICHSEGETRTRKLFARVCNALVPGGLMLVVDFIADNERRGEGTGPLPLLFALNMLVHSKEGSTFTFAEFEGWGREAGFETCEHINTSGPPSVLAFKK